MTPDSLGGLRGGFWQSWRAEILDSEPDEVSSAKPTISGWKH
jgi:hypothetical protein